MDFLNKKRVRPPRRKRPPVGSRPGTLVVHEHAVPTKIRVLRYDADGVEDMPDVPVGDVRALLTPGKQCWIDLQGLGDEVTLLAMGEAFGIHALALADVVNVPQRPKTEVFAEHRMFIMRMLQLRPEGVHSEQVSLFFGDGFVLSFQEEYGDVLDAVRDRLFQGKGPMRRLGSDYLAFAIIDAVLDGFFPVLELLGDQLEVMEDSVVAQASEDMLTQINGIRRELLSIRRTVQPLRDALNTLIRDDEVFVHAEARVYFRDCYDHCVQLADTVETSREMASTLLSTYLSAVANKTNDIMKVLTIMASIFIPLTFLAGLYGMNFEYMPELSWHYSYPALLVLMGVIAVGMVFYLRTLGWLGGRQRGSSPANSPERGSLQ